MFNDESSQQNLQQYQRRNANDGKVPSPCGSSSLPLNPEPTPAPSISHTPNENISKLVLGTLSKVTVLIPLLELVRLAQLQNQVSEFLKLNEDEGEQDPPIVLQSEIINRYKDASFYLSLHMGNDILHNCMLDSWASTNVMPLSVMRQLGLEVH